MTSEQSPVSPPFAGTGFEHIHSSLLAADQELTEASDILAILEHQRDLAVAAAAAPFEERINDSQTQVTDAQNSLSSGEITTQLKELEMDDLSTTALDIILRSNSLTVEQFAQGFKDLSLGNDDFSVRQTRRSLTEFKGFRALKHYLQAPEDVKGNPSALLPIGIFSIGWREEKDIQAEHEGRPSGTGVYKKQVSAAIGFANTNDLLIEQHDISPEGTFKPIMQPKTILLALRKALVLTSDEGWGGIEARLHEEAITKAMLLFGTPSESGRSVPDLDWAKSERKDLSPVSSKGAPSRSNDARFIAWGSQLVGALTRLSVDSHIPPVTRNKLFEIQNRLLSDAS